MPAKFCSDDFSCTFRYSRNSSRQLFSQALSDRNPHVYWLACRSTSRPAGRKTRIGPKRSPIASNHAEREQTCCMREPMGKCHPLAVIACSRRRLTRHRREEAGESEHEPSLLSAKQVAYYNVKVTINHDNLTDHQRATSTVHDIWVTLIPSARPQCLTIEFCHHIHWLKKKVPVISLPSFHFHGPTAAIKAQICKSVVQALEGWIFGGGSQCRPPRNPPALHGSPRSLRKTIGVASGLSNWVCHGRALTNGPRLVAPPARRTTLTPCTVRFRRPATSASWARRVRLGGCVANPWFPLRKTLWMWWLASRWRRRRRRRTRRRTRTKTITRPKSKTRRRTRATRRAHPRSAFVHPWPRRHSSTKLGLCDSMLFCACLTSSARCGLNWFLRGRRMHVCPHQVLICQASRVLIRSHIGARRIPS